MAYQPGGFIPVVIRNFLLIIAFIFILSCNSVKAWDTEDYELFDLVEEVHNQTFYEVLGLEKTASSSEIRRQYYKLSLKIHPDHNKSPNAEQEFRQLVSVAEVLRDENKRQKYDNILENGLPDWKHAIYYYRKVRKYGLLEISAILFAIITVGQYIVSWAMYLERKYEMEEVLFSRLKKRDRKCKKNKQNADEATKEAICELVLNQLQKPRFLDLLPFAIVRGSVLLFINIPHGCTLIKQKITEWRERQNAAHSNEQDSDGTSGEEHIRKPRRKRILEIPNLTSECFLESVDEPTLNGTMDMQILETKESQTQLIQPRGWTEEDVAALTKAMNKFPSGLPERWEKIADFLNRSLQDVTSMTKTLKGGSTTRLVSTSLQGLTANKLAQNSVDVDMLTEREPVEDVRNLIYTNTKESQKRTERIEQTKSVAAPEIGKLRDETAAPSGEEESSDDLWTQVQQKALELALSHFPRGTEDRWEKVAKCVPDKSVEECMKRYKRLVELVKKKRSVNVIDK